MNKVTIYTDGACERNPGPGGWAAVLQCGSVRREISGAEAATTNNRMEMQAAISALEALRVQCEVDLYTDSEYLRQGITEWIALWRARNWKRGKEAVKNQDLWKRLDKLAQTHVMRWHWVRGHSGNRENEKCDRMAVAAIQALKKRVTREELKEALELFKQARDGAKAPPGLF